MTQLLFDQETRTVLCARFINLRGPADRTPDASLVIPVNAENDLDNVVHILHTISGYSGESTFEVILVVNNYPPENPPGQIKEFEELGIETLAIPYVQRRGGVALAARIHGVRIAKSETIISFDSDCTLLNVRELLDWYVAQFKAGCDLAYTHVDYNNLPKTIPMRLHMVIHHATRWFRRNILRMPTSRGSNYAVCRTLMLDLFDQGKLLYDINIGPVIKSVGGRIVYSGAKNLTVYTSGRFFKGTRQEIFKYWLWRIGYYWRVFVVNRKVPAGSDKGKI